MVTESGLRLISFFFRNSGRCSIGFSAQFVVATSSMKALAMNKISSVKGAQFPCQRLILTRNFLYLLAPNLVQTVAICCLFTSEELARMVTPFASILL
jgi:hypothetical protein